MTLIQEPTKWEFVKISVNSKCRYLTPGKLYKFLGFSVGGYVFVRDNSNKIRPYSLSNFENKSKGVLKKFESVK